MHRTGVLAAVITLALAASACGDDAVPRDADGRVTEPGEISVFDLREGDCFDDPEQPGVTQVDTVWVVPCAEPHDNEIYLAFQLPDGPYPGAAAIDAMSDQRCFDAFETFVAVDYFESELEFFPVTPTEGSWEEGDRTVYCALFALDLSKLVGSMRGTGR